MKYYTNREIKNQENLQGTATIITYEDIVGKYSGEVIKKDSEIVISGRQKDMLWSVIEDGNCEWDLIVDQDDNSRDQFKLSYIEGKTNFGVLAVNC